MYLKNMHTSCVTQHRNVNKDESRAVYMLYTQGHLISKCPFGVFKPTKCAGLASKYFFKNASIFLLIQPPIRS